MTSTIYLMVLWGNTFHLPCEGLRWWGLKGVSGHYLELFDDVLRRLIHVSTHFAGMILPIRTIASTKLYNNHKGMLLFFMSSCPSLSFGYPAAAAPRRCPLPDASRHWQFYFTLFRHTVRSLDFRTRRSRKKIH